MPPGAGPLWVGGMAFADDAAGAGPWASLPPALLTMPEILIAGSSGRRMLTACAIAGPDLDPAGVHARVAARIAGMRAAPLPP
ncbi:MAG: isochorismate synthase, partial [Acidobacteria bacterium]